MVRNEGIIMMEVVRQQPPEVVSITMVVDVMVEVMLMAGGSGVVLTAL